MPMENVRGSTLSYAERGSGSPPVVLLHGFPLDSRMWEAQAAALSDRWRVITLDLRGFGKSPSNDPFTLAEQAELVHGLLEKIGALPCVLGGLSMGGYIAFALVREFLKDLRGLILVDTKAAADTSEGKQNRDKMIDMIRQAGAQGSKAVADQMLGKLLSDDTIRHRPQVVRDLRDMMESQPPTTLAHALAAMRDRPDQTDFLPSVAVPTLVLVGDADTITPPDIARGMQEKIPNATLEIIRGAGHMAPMEQPEQVTRAMRRFLESM